MLGQIDELTMNSCCRNIFVGLERMMAVQTPPSTVRGGIGCAVTPRRSS